MMKRKSFGMKSIRTGFKVGALLMPFILIGCASAGPASAASEGDADRDAGMPISVLVDKEPWTLQTVAVGESAYAIRVIDEDGHNVQVIDDLVSRPPFVAKDLLDIRDYNADGHPDILARTLPAGASAIIGGVLYVFNPAGQKFVESKGIEQEGDITIKSKGCISVEYRSDAMNYRKDHYCWEGNRWEFQRTTED